MAKETKARSEGLAKTGRALATPGDQVLLNSFVSAPIGNITRYLGDSGILLFLTISSPFFELQATSRVRLCSPSLNKRAGSEQRRAQQLISASS